MVYIGLFLLGVFLSYLAFSLLGGRSFWFYKARDEKEGKSLGDSSGGKIRTCPLCGHVLLKGQKVKSLLFRGGTEAGGVKEQVAHLLGCPFCYPPNREHKRVCPVCGAILPPEGYLIARFFSRKGKKRKHIHVLGCTECRKKAAPSGRLNP
jgi:hypothetical protein